MADILAWIGPRIGKPPGFERLARRLLPPEKCGHMPELCLVRDGSLFVTRPYLPLGWHVTFFGSYEPELRAIIRTVLPHGGVAIDVGANVGWHTLLMARLVGAEGHVLAIEANLSVCEQLLRHVRINRLSQVDVMTCAVAETEKTLQFFGPDADDPRSADGHVVSDPAQDKKRLSLTARSLDSIAAEAALNRLDLIKIDVEGYEWPVLKGAAATIERFRPHIFFEYDPAYTDRGGGSAALFSDFFRGHQYHLFAIGRNWARALDDFKWPEGVNLWAMPTA